MVRRATALAAGVLLVTLVGAPAASAAGPSGVRADVTNVRIACTGDTVSGTANVVTAEAVDVVAVLSAQHSARTFERTDRYVTFRAVPGTTRYAFDINAAGLPLTVRDYKVDVWAGTGTGTSNAAPVHLCAPAAVVPEVPAAVLVPASLATTGLLVVAAHRRRSEGRT